MLTNRVPAFKPVVRVRRRALIRRWRRVRRRLNILDDFVHSVAALLVTLSAAPRAARGAEIFCFIAVLERVEQFVRTILRASHRFFSF